METIGALDTKEIAIATSSKSTYKDSLLKAFGHEDLNEIFISDDDDLPENRWNKEDYGVADVDQCSNAVPNPSTVVPLKHGQGEDKTSSIMVEVPPPVVTDENRWSNDQAVPVEEGMLIDPKIVATNEASII
ncbi:hypothetical protein RIF29_14552 [Crotalaria pallida]|uniref:Uncharacterized protein n=1 Tax=Crotalaria pallida TaxID=3830 RepID=A0AAN9FE12_CROPI